MHNGLAVKSKFVNCGCLFIMPKPQPAPIQTNGDAGTLADVLVAIGALDAARAQQVKLAEIESGSTQEEIIRKSAMVSEDRLVQAKAQLYNIPYIDLSITPVAPAALSVLPSQVAERFKVFPVGIDRKDKSLILAMADPLDLSAIEFIEQKTGFHVKPRAALVSQITDFIQNRYASTLTQEVSAALKEVEPERDRLATLGTTSGGFIREEKVAQI